MAIVVKAPKSYEEHLGGSREIIFLGGQIDNGNASLWQKRVAEELDGYSDILILDPRRDNWDTTLDNDIKCPQFFEQVSWELQAQEIAHTILYVFAPDAVSAQTSKAPITLLELGLFIGSTAELLVVCPPGYYRKGNVDIVCKRYGLRVYESIDEMMLELHNRFKFRHPEILELKPV